MAVYSIAVAADTHMQESAATNNYGADTIMTAGDSFAKLTNTERAIMTFNLTGFPGISGDITAVTLDYTGGANSVQGSPGPWTHALHRLTRSDWVELQATWNIYKTANNWTTAGGDYDAATKHTWNPPEVVDPTALTIPTGANFVTLVKDAIDNRAGLLHLLWKEDDESDTTNQYRAVMRSDEHATSPAPVLNITYGAEATGQPILRRSDHVPHIALGNSSVRRRY